MNEKKLFLQIENIIYNMQKYIRRKAESIVKQYLEIFPVVVILGARQCGKSTLVKKMAQEMKSFLYLDLQNINDLNKLSEPSLFFEANKEATICLDEIQLLPELFSVLRSEIDRNRFNGRFILLGSASRDLIQKTSESLAGRVGLIELAPFSLSELNNDYYQMNTHWFRGGFPESYLAASDTNAMIWLENFIRTFVERDIPQLGFQISALQLRRFFMLCAHNQGQLLNASRFGEALNLTHPTTKRYADLLEQTFLLRTLKPFERNIKKRLVKSPKLYIRDTGILHRLLQISDFNGLLGNHFFGSSWEGFVIENIISEFPEFSYYFYRTSSGNEVDLVIETPSKLFVVECKASAAPQLTTGNWSAIEDLQPDKTFIVAPVSSTYPIKENVIVTHLQNFLTQNLPLSKNHTTTVK
jgi:predicted AAA+ superfamily ATPase